MLKYLMVFGENDRPKTFKPTRTVELSKDKAFLYIEGDNMNLDNYFEGFVEEFGVVQSVASKGQPKVFTAGSFDEMVSRLALFDGFISGVVFVDECVVFRDFVGLIPVFAGGNPLAVTNVASEASARGLKPFKPCTIYGVSTRREEKYNGLVGSTTDVSAFLNKLSEAVKRFCPRRTAVFFSGGLDSLLLTKIILDQGLRPLLLTAGIAGSFDLVAAERAASLLGLDVERILVDERMLRETLDSLSKLFEPPTTMDASIGAAMMILSRRAAELGFYGAVLGQGADEIFGGYSKYEKILASAGYGGLADALMHDLTMLAFAGLIRDFTAIRVGGAYPLPLYLVRDVLEAGLAVPVSMKIAHVGGRLVRKHFLRLVCRELGLDELADVGKKALQYGSGIEKMVKKLR